MLETRRREENEKKKTKGSRTWNKMCILFGGLYEELYTYQMSEKDEELMLAFGQLKNCQEITSLGRVARKV